MNKIFANRSKLKYSNLVRYNIQILIYWEMFTVFSMMKAKLKSKIFFFCLFFHDLTMRVKGEEIAIQNIRHLTIFMIQPSFRGTTTSSPHCTPNNHATLLDNFLKQSMYSLYCKPIQVNSAMGCTQIVIIFLVDVIKV